MCAIAYNLILAKSFDVAFKATIDYWSFLYGTIRIWVMIIAYNIDISYSISVNIEFFLVWEFSCLNNVDLVVLIQEILFTLSLKHK